MSNADTIPALLVNDLKSVNHGVIGGCLYDGEKCCPNVAQTMPKPCPM